VQLVRSVPFVLLCAALAAGCSSDPSNSSRIDYQKKAEQAAPLDVPPPLKVPVAGSDGLDVPAGVGKPAAVLPQPYNVRVVRDGEARWLVVDATPQALWLKVHDFLKAENLDVKEEEPRIGVIETDWAQNLADIPESGLRSILSKVVPYMYDSDTRDKYRLRLEQGTQPGTTEIFMNHYGMENVQRGETTRWVPRPSDPELAAEMLSRLMQFLGLTPEQAQAQLAAKNPPSPRARVQGDALLIDEGFARAWRLTGLALDRVGLVVEDLNREKGLYYVRQTEAFAVKEDENKGWFSGWFSSAESTETRFRLVLKGDDNSSRLTALDDKGEALPPEVTKMILDRLQEQLR
jgi:outer membrane protein assembly factor BamC